jgi:hypothetical protein
MSVAAIDHGAVDLSRFHAAWLDEPPAHPANGDAAQAPARAQPTHRSAEEIFGLPSPLLLAQVKPSAGMSANQPIGGLFYGAKVRMVDDQGRIGVPGTDLKIPTRGFDPGLAVYFPESKTVFVTSRDQARLPSIGGAFPDSLKNMGFLKPVATYQLGNPNPDVGVGNSVIDAKGDGFFYNARVKPETLVKAVLESRQNPGKEFNVGSVTAGFIHSPYCDAPGKTPGIATRFAAGIGYPLQLAVRDGQVSLKGWQNGISIPLTAMDKGMQYLTKLISNVDNASCNTRNLLQDLASKAKAALGEISGQSVNKLSEFGGAVAGSGQAAAAALLYLLGRDRLNPAF